MKKFLIIGFIVALIIAIPATIFILKQQQQTQSKATPATTLAFSTLSQPVHVGDNVSLDVTMNPGTNQVSFVTLNLQYDGSKLKRGATGIVPNSNAFPTTLEGPVYDQCSGNNCTMSITVSVGADPTKVITSTTTVATVNFQAIATTGSTPTQVTFGQATKVLSIGPSDQPSENVLSSTSPASITIIDATNTSGTPSPTGGTTETPVPTSGGNPTDTPTSTPAATETPTPTASTNQAPVCSSLALSQTTGSAPLNITLTADGNDSDGTVSKVTFNYGDGAVQDVTTGSGIGSASVSAQVAHTYPNAGTFTATALLTDNNGAISDTTTCSQTVTVTAVTPSLSSTPTPTTILLGNATPTVTPRLITGPRETIMGIGALGVVLSLVGGFLIFGL